MNKVLVVRAESSEGIGAGHVMRCLAIAQEWIRRGGCVTFLSRQQLPWVSKRLHEEGCELVYLLASAGSEDDARETADFCRMKGSVRPVVDGYWMGVGLLPILREFEPLVIDDFGGKSFAGARWLLNPGCGKHPECYTSAELDGIELLSGSEFLPIRREFLAAREATNPAGSDLRNILVTLGGGQNAKLAAEVTEIVLRSVPRDALVSVIAEGGARDARLAALAAANPSRVSVANATSDFPLHVARADLVISGAGSTAWEVCCLGRPAILLLLADNQMRVAASVKAGGAAVVVDARRGDFSGPLAAEFSSLTQERRADTAARAASLVDGLGAARIVDKIQ